MGQDAPGRGAPDGAVVVITKAWRASKNRIRAPWCRYFCSNTSSWFRQSIVTAFLLKKSCEISASRRTP